MIILDCVYTEPKPLNLTSAEAIFALSRVTLFLGTQKLIVNNADFTSEVPLFWAGHELREIVHKQKTKQSEKCIFIPMNGYPELMFSLNDDGEINIAGLAIICGAGREHREASVSLVELEKAVNRYSRKIYKMLSKLYLPLRDDSFRDWFYGKYMSPGKEKFTE